jgi:hypothetical protein
MRRHAADILTRTSGESHRGRSRRPRSKNDTMQEVPSAARHIPAIVPPYVRPCLRYEAGSIEANNRPPSRRAGRFVRPCDGPAGMATPTPSGPPHRLTFRAGSIERTTRSMSRIGSTGEPTRHVCRHGFANGVSRAPSARLSCGAGFWRRRPRPASAAVRAVRLLPAANAFRPAHRLPPAPQVSCRGGMVRCGCQRSIAYRRASRIASIVGAVKRPTGPCNS